MALTIEEVKHIALLARIALTFEEEHQYLNELDDILLNFLILQEIDTDQVPPTGHSGSMNSVMREDEPGISSPKADVLANAPRTEVDYIRVRAVLE